MTKNIKSTLTVPGKNWTFDSACFTSDSNPGNLLPDNLLKSYQNLAKMTSRLLKLICARKKHIKVKGIYTNRQAIQ